MCRENANWLLKTVKSRDLKDLKEKWTKDMDKSPKEISVFNRQIENI